MNGRARRVRLTAGTFALVAVLLVGAKCGRRPCTDGDMRSEPVQDGKGRYCVQVQVCEDGHYDEGTINPASCHRTEG